MLIPKKIVPVSNHHLVDQFTTAYTGLLNMSYVKMVCVDTEDIDITSLAAPGERDCPALHIEGDIKFNLESKDDLETLRIIGLKIRKIVKDFRK